MKKILLVYQHGLLSDGLSKYVLEEICLKFDTMYIEELFTEYLFRCHPYLIKILEKYPQDNFKIVDIPDDVEWYIDYLTGFERIVEKHRNWN